MKDTIEVALAAFLHDWGKLFQRAEAPLSAQAQRMTEMLCPTRDGHHTHHHVLWTNEALETHLEWLSRELDRGRIQRLASHHHRPGEPDEWLIAEADRLASGHDRRPAEEEQEGFRSVPLSSVFGGLRLRHGPSSSRGVFLPRIVQADETMLPDRENPRRSLVPEYESLCGAVDQQLKRWSQVPLARVCDAVDSFSARVLSTTAASTIDLPDVSLHDHARLVAAVAAALHAYHRDCGNFDESAIRNRQQNKFIMLGGDLSGIQRYLFAMPKERAKGVARAYRARSFYLSILTHAASLRLLTDLDLPCFSRVLDAGGRFALLLPDTVRTHEMVASVHRDIERWMLDRHGGGLAMNLCATVRVSGAQFLSDGFADLYRAFAEATETSKRRKFAGWLMGEGRWLPENQRLGYIHTRERQGEDLARDRDIGRCLPRTEYIGLWSGNAPDGLLKTPIDVLGYQLQLLRGLPNGRSLSEAADFFAISAVPDSASWIPLRPLAAYLPHLSRDDVDQLGGTSDKAEMPEESDEFERLEVGKLATFEHLALLARRPHSRRPGRLQGLPAIACLKADVDRLGMLFSDGFEGDVSFGRVATLSRQLDLFFKGLLTNRLSDPGGPFRHVYTVFAGGDDLLLVGPWPTMFELARALRSWFAQLTSEHPEVTLSGGLAIGHQRMPVSALAQEADGQLGNAKAAGRNCIGIFNEVYTWPEYAQALDIGARLDRMVCLGDGGESLAINTGFVYRLLQYDRMATGVDQARRAETDIRPGEPIPTRIVRLQDLRAELTWRSHLIYDLARNIRDRIRRDAPRQVHDDYQWLEELLTKQVQPQGMRPLKLAATYALYRNRGG